jgi:hypothetical protein
VEGFTPIDFDFDYNKPQISASSGNNTYFNDYHGGHTLLQDLEQKIEGSQSVIATPSAPAIYDSSHGFQREDTKMGDKIHYSYAVPNNTSTKLSRVLDGNGNDQEAFFRTKVTPLSTYVPTIPKSAIRRAGVSQPQTRMHRRKDA